jgi:RES domain-containing protein
VRAYRLCKEKYSAEVLEGEGGRIAGGRWHSQGRRIVYSASSEALAVLEVRVHVGRYAPKVPYVMHAIDIPDECIAELRTDQLPNDWNVVPYGVSSQRVGDEWLASGRSAALRVSSVHSSSDSSVLVNPEHADFQSIRVTSRVPYVCDRRLFVRRAVGRTRRIKGQ